MFFSFSNLCDRLWLCFIVYSCFWCHLLFLQAFRIYSFYILYLWGLNLRLLLLLLMLLSCLMYLMIFDCELTFGTSSLRSYMKDLSRKEFALQKAREMTITGASEPSSNISGLIWESEDQYLILSLLAQDFLPSIPASILAIKVVPVFRHTCLPLCMSLFLSFFFF